MTLRTAVIGVGHLGRQHARIHATLASEGKSEFVAVCDIDDSVAGNVANEWSTERTADWSSLIGKCDAVSLAVPTEAHAEIGCALLDAGISVLVEKPISRTLDEADRMIAAAHRGGAVLQVGHVERFNPALVALRPHVRGPLYFEIHRVGMFTARSLDVDVVLDLMIHDLDIVQWLVGEDVAVSEVHAVGIPVLTERVDAANVRLEFQNGAVANITASRIGMEKIRKMRFFQPHDYVAVDYATRRATISNLVPAQGAGIWPGVNINHLEIEDVEPLRAEIDAFVDAVIGGKPSPVSGEDGGRALAIALRALDQIYTHAERAGLPTFAANSG